MNKFVLALAALSLPLVFVSSAKADDAVSLTLQGGATEVLHVPTQYPTRVVTDNRFNVGGQAEGKLLFRLVPNLAIGPDVAVMYLPQSTPNTEASVLWTLGGAVRLQGSKAHAAWSPYLEAAGAVAKQSNIWNPNLGGTVGVDFAVEPTHTFWVGPFVNWNHTFQTNTAGERQTAFLNHHDGNVLVIGFGVTFDGPVSPVVHQTTVVQTVQAPAPAPAPLVITKTVEAPAAPTAPVARQNMFVAPETVQFAKDSSALDSSATSMLDAVVVNANGNPDATAEVRGHASNEGEKGYNLSLSRARAQAVVDYLVAHGVAASRLTVAALGATGDGSPARIVDFVVNVSGK